uniref:Peptidase C14 caspase domain-containing protein n=1 Tax=Corethron hystrix TaxID=216773 RepID=A0A7S1FX38_9STRA|mmetsp:Transcript_34615/g.80036  ORF Transcript_34615/g.80036 Transcript_34615/m.80036 type:complete len:204 (+) Transcript_34615:74-685(+)
MTYYERAQGLIKADVRMISGCRDSQTSADVGNVSEFELPDPAGKAGGACTSALLKVLYNDGSVADDMSYVDLLHKMRDELRGDYSQIPQLSSSRPFDLKKKVEFANVEPGYTKRAVLVGINYVGQQGELSGCHNDVLNIKEYIENVHGFEEHNITVLMDDGYNTEPTRDNIMQAYNDIVSISKSGDGVFLHYSGRWKDLNLLS